MPRDRTIEHVEPPAPPRRRSDRIVTYAGRSPTRLIGSTALIALLMVLLQLFLYEVIGNRGDIAETAVRGLVTSLVPIAALVLLVRSARRE